MKLYSFLTFILAASIAFFSTSHAEACSRVLYTGANNLKIVGRSLDWKTPIPTNLYVYPRGIKKSGSDKPGTISWTSKYGSIYAVGYDAGITEGMNEKGLVVNGLFCKGTEYVNAQTSNNAPMSLSMFVAWMLDNNATTTELVSMLRNNAFALSGATFDGGTVSALHWGVTDAQGHCAVIEFDKGNMMIYEGDNIPVMTNDPGFMAMNSINDYWKGVGGRNMLPGTVKSADRFVRAYYFDGHVERTDDPEIGFAIVRSILKNVSVPYLYSIETEPNVSSTQWCSFADITDLRYYFDIVTNMGVYYIDLNKCNLRKGAPVMKLDTSRHTSQTGDITNMLTPVQGFKPMY